MWRKASALAVCALVLFGCQSCSHTPGHPVLPFGALDTPGNGSVVAGSVTVGGWALSEDLVQSVGVYIDRRYMRDAGLGIARPDVQKQYPAFREAGTAGWSATLNFEGVAAGPHAVEVQIRSKTGGVTTYESRVSVR